MQTTVFPGETISANGHVLQALQLNKDHQAAVKIQIEHLEDDLAALDKLLVCTSSSFALRRLSRHPRLPRKSTTKASSNPKWVGISTSPDRQQFRLQLLPKNLFLRWANPPFRARTLLNASYLQQDSPFYADGERRQRYVDFTGYHPSPFRFPCGIWEILTSFACRSEDQRA
jgi:hypothetical protein